MKIPAERIHYTRKYKRYPTQREARYFLENTTKDGQACSIVNVSRKGMGIIFHTDAVAAAGQIPLNVQELNIDALSLSAQSF